MMQISSDAKQKKIAVDDEALPKVISRHIEAATKNDELVQRRRNLLIEAAIQVFLEKGFHNATVRDIGRAANMTQGTIYNYVRSKDDILYMVCDRIVGEYQSATHESIQASHGPDDLIRSAVRAISSVMYDYRREILLIYQNSHLLEPQSRRVILARVEDFIGTFEQLIINAGHDANVNVTRPHFAANVVTFLPVMIALRGWSLRAELTREELIDEITEFLVRGLGF